MSKLYHPFNPYDEKSIQQFFVNHVVMIDLSTKTKLAKLVESGRALIYSLMNTAKELFNISLSIKSKSIRII
jgi:hypothetical protein